MKHIHLKLAGLAQTLSLIGLISIGSSPPLQAQPLPSSFGVWDRGEAMDPKVYPLVKGTSCDASWNEVEKKPGGYDWTTMNQAIERAY